MARKVFISILGTSSYLETKYFFGKEPKGDEKPTRFVQEATVSNLCSSWTEQDKVRIFLTNDAKMSNWVDNGNKELYEGLQSRLKNLNFKFDLKAIPIKEGFSEDEIWSIFETVFNEIEYDSEIYFDITHAFRSIPMLVMVLINYSKFLKNVKVKGIYYGVFEKLGPAYKVKEIEVKNRYAPIIDLIAFSDLQDWTSATSEFINTGRLKNIIKKVNYSNNFEFFDFSEEILTCRGIEIQNGEKVIKLKKELLKATDEKIPFKAIKEKIIDKVKDYKQEDVFNGFRAVKYCIDFDIIQQGITLLIESVISKVLVDIGVTKRAKLTSFKVRNVVGVCLQKNSIDEINIEDFLNVYDKKYESTKQKKIKEYSSYCDSIFKLSYKDDLTNKVFNELSQKVRNDINHAGYRPEPLESNVFKSTLEDYYEICCELLSC